MSEEQTPLAAFLADPARFEDCAADYMLFSGESMEAAQKSCDEVRDILSAFVTFKESRFGYGMAAAALSLALLLTDNITKELERSK